MQHFITAKQGIYKTTIKTLINMMNFSEQTYKHYYNTLQPLPELFQATQSIQLKLMAMIESQFVFQLNIDAHRDMLLECK